jgi:Mrp family chromosome partitioning ATPase
LDRIRKALDLARQERDRAIAPNLESETSRAAAAKAFEPRPIDAKIVGTKPTHLPAGLVQFTQSNSFEPSPEHLESERILGPHKSGSDLEPVAAAFRMLRTQVLLRLDEREWRSLAVMSPSSEDGKTTTAVNLAISIANDHRHTVLLVDFDLKQPQIGAKWGITPTAGTDDILRGDARIEDCLIHPRGYERLIVLPARAALANSSEALAGPRCRQLVQELRGRYADRVLIFDLPPLLGADDALAFAPLVDCALMVISEGYTKRDDLLRSMELLRNTPVVGTVLNRATDVSSAYG